MELRETYIELCLDLLTRKTISELKDGGGEFDQHQLLGLFLHKCTWHLVLWLRDGVVLVSFAFGLNLN